MPSFDDYIEEEAMKMGPPPKSYSLEEAGRDEAMYHGGKTMNKAYPKQGSGKPNKMFYKAKPSGS